MSTTATTELLGTEPTVIYLDPKTVRTNGANARGKLRKIDELADSIREVGVLEPVLVARANGNGVFRLIAGERRTEAAIKAGARLPAIVIPTGDVPAVEALLMLTENESRDPLSTVERARAVQTALDLGVEPSVVAKAASTSVESVESLRTVAGSVVASTVSEKHDLTLDQALVLAEFADDKEAVKTLTVIAVEDPGRWDFTLTRLRREREAAAKLAAKLAPFVEAKVRVLTETDISQTTTSRQERAHTRTPIARLTTDKGKLLTAGNHKACPGRSVGIFKWDSWDDDDVVEFCEEPEKHGHLPKTTASRSGSTSSAPDTRTDEQKEADSAERRKVIANNKAFDVANEVRKEFVKTLLTRKTVPKGTERFVTTHIVTAYSRTEAPTALYAELVGRPLTGAMGDVRETLLDSLPDNRVLLALLAYVAASIEAVTDRSSWRTHDTARTAYFRFLESCGYTLSDVEAEHATETERYNAEIRDRRAKQLAETQAASIPKTAAKPKAAATKQPAKKAAAATKAATK